MNVSTELKIILNFAENSNRKVGKRQRPQKMKEIIQGDSNSTNKQRTTKQQQKQNTTLPYRLLHTNVGF